MLVATGLAISTALGIILYLAVRAVARFALDVLRDDRRERA